VIDLPFTSLRLVPGILGWPSGLPIGAVGRGDRVCLPRPSGRVARSRLGNRFIHSASRCQSSGRCKVIWPRPFLRTRPGTRQAMHAVAIKESGPEVLKEVDPTFPARSQERAGGHLLPPRRPQQGSSVHPGP